MRSFVVKGGLDLLIEYLRLFVDYLQTEEGLGVVAADQIDGFSLGLVGGELG